MSNASRFTGYVVLDGEKVLTYTELRTIGFTGISMESHFLAGNHGVDGLFIITQTDPQKELFDDHGFSVAKVETPWFKDKRLTMEPVVPHYVTIDEDNGLEVSFEIRNGFTKIEARECDGLEIWVKPSISFYSNNSNEPEADLLEVLGWKTEQPKMPSPEEVLRQLSSSQSLEERFAKAFSEPTEATPRSTEKPIYPVNHGTNIIQFADDVFAWYDGSGNQGGVCASLAGAQNSLANYAALDTAKASPPVKKAPAPIDPDSLLDGMFGILIK